MERFGRSMSTSFLCRKSTTSSRTALERVGNFKTQTITTLIIIIMSTKTITVNYHNMYAKIYGGEVEM